ncbi:MULTISPECIES: periplasmic heavy metal sensor [Rhodopirellula]|uniref:periplasmic heavy metal sensor n=1 Tax=Rhodopirellula TaxID=265488 RepID=UPI0025804CC8|nr:periplasmic heavy metal sensor [Rhodopirellula sp. UBA1907]
MKFISPFGKPTVSAALIASSLVLFAPSLFAQTKTDPHGAHPAASETADGDLATQLQALRKKVADLETTLQSQHTTRYGTDAKPGAMSNMTMDKGAADPSSGSDSAGMGGMKGMGDMKMGGMKTGMMKGMGGMNQDTTDSSMSSGGMGGMGMGMKGKSGGMGMMSGMGGMSGGMGMGMGMMKGMGMMGRNPAMKSSMNGMGSMGSMSMPSALPGFAGASHLYHIGETGFFLDHPQHITLSHEQQLKLNQLKEAALLATATAERKIEEAEQELWTLTAEAQPDINKIEAKAREIAKLQADKRIAFIRSVGEAAEVLTKEQRQTLVGMASPTDSMPAE